MPDTVLLGIDGGGTRGRLVAADAQGRVLGTASTGPLNPNNQSGESLRRTLADGLRALRPGLPPDAPLRAFAGIAGVKSAADAARFRAEALAAAEGALGALDVANDTDILLAAGLHGRPGIALIVGTGSHCLGRSAAGAVATCGGWGYLMDDCGSGFALGHAALRAAVRVWDGRRAPTVLAERVREALGIADPADALHRVYDGAYGVEGVAALAPLVTAAAADGDEAALGMLRAAAADAAELVAVVHARLGLGAAPEVVLTGSVALHPLAGAFLVEQIRARVPGARVAGSALPPVAGAVVRAAQAACQPLTPNFLAALAEGTRALDAA